MNLQEIKSTHNRVAEKAIVGSPCYAEHDNNIISIWDGGKWIGYYKADEDGELTQYDILDSDANFSETTE